MELSPENLARFPCLVVLKGVGLGMKSETTDGGKAIANSADVDTQGVVTHIQSVLPETRDRG